MTEQRGFSVTKETHDRADFILDRLGLDWSDLEGKNSIDLGSGESALTQVAQTTHPDTQILAYDINPRKNWQLFPWTEGSPPIQGNVSEMPFRSESVDYVLAHALPGWEHIPEAARILKPGGELRMYPISGRELEQWTTMYYLHTKKDYSLPEANHLLQKFEAQIQEADGWLPNEYVEVRDEAINNLTPEDKSFVIEKLTQTISDSFDLPFTCQIDDPQAREPNAILIYKKQ